MTWGAARFTGGIEHNHERLEHLYEVSKLFAAFESVQETFDAALGVAAQTLPLRSAILIEVEDGQTMMTVWPTRAAKSAEMRAAKANMQTAYASLVGDAQAEAPRSTEEGRTALPPLAPAERAAKGGPRFIVIPLVVGRRRVFGALQIEGASAFDESDLVFVNAIANQLAIAIDRRYAWRREVAGRERAEALTQRYEALVDNLDRAFVWEAEANSLRMTYVSGPAEALLGYPRQHWLEEPGAGVNHVHPDDRPAVTAMLERVVRERRDQRLEHRSTTQDGRVLWFHTGVHLGAAGTLQGVSVDITPLKHAEEAQAFTLEAGATLGESLDYPTALKRIARLGVPRLGDLCFFDVITSDGRIERAAWAHADPAKERALGKALGEAPSMEVAPHAVARAIRTGASTLVADVDEAWREAASTSRRLLQLMRDYGVRSVITVPMTLAQRTLGALTFCFAESGRRHGAADLALAEDLARRTAFALENARLYEQAQQAIHEREQILAIVSHDLKNPLASILLNANMLEQRPGQPERRDALPRIMGRIRRSAERMRRLIDDLLDFASIEAGGLAITRGPQEVASILNETIANFEAAALEKHLKVTAEVEPHLAQVSCDRDRILQVMSNLVGNAVKVTPAEGLIVLRVEPHGDGVAVSVSDTGPGISEQNLARIFERYWRGEAVYNGTGLGLAIVRGIVRAHGGRIWATSEMGHGATFTFTLPAVGPAEPRPTGVATTGRSAGVEDLRR